jgi:CysZ protein
MRLVAWSIFLILVTGILTWIGYREAINLINGLTGHFFQTPPDASGILGWLKGWGWVVMKYLFLIITRIASFYLAFLLSYCLTTPGYIFLSGSVEKIHPSGIKTDEANSITSRISMFWIDLWEGIKIGLIGILVTIVALAVNFIPIVGQILVFLLYIFYSALMFIDYPASNRHWTLKKKINWILLHYSISVRIGILPAVISMIPVINIIFMAIFFPLFTVHTTLNYIAVENGQNSGNRD